MTIEKKVTLPILGYYDTRIKKWVIEQIDNSAQADWLEENEFASGFIKNKPEGILTAGNLEFTRKESDPNYISVIADGKEIADFFASKESISAELSFISAELVTFLQDSGLTPSSYNEYDWDPETNPIESMTAENGPYLVFMVQAPEGNLIHIKCLKEALAKYATKKDLENLRTEITKSIELEII